MGEDLLMAGYNRRHRASELFCPGPARFFSIQQLWVNSFLVFCKDNPKAQTSSPPKYTVPNNAAHRHANILQLVFAF